MGKNQELRATDLYQRTDPTRFDFETRAELEDMTQMLGQPRAVAAMRFGIGIDQDGYNIFALGPTGTGKRQFIRDYVEKRAAEEPVPDDWCYVNNFEDRHKPKAIRLPAGKGLAFRDDVDELIEGLTTALSAAFESEEYQARRQSINEEFQEEQSSAFQELQGRAEEKGVTLLRTPTGLIFAPIRDGEVLSSEEVQELSKEERDRLESEEGCGILVLPARSAALQSSTLVALLEHLELPVLLVT